MRRPLIVRCSKGWVTFLCNYSVAICAAVSLISFPAEARVTRIETTSREVVAYGMPFGDTGPYEKLRGTVYFAVDANDSRNAVVFDLDKAPRNKGGLVEFSADFFVLQPVDATKGNGGLLFDVGTRGNKNILSLLNDTSADASQNDPTRPVDFGNGFLLRKGYTLAWVGWEPDTAPGNNRLTVQFPIAMKDGEPITGQILAEFFDARGASVDPVFTLPLGGGRTARSYESISTDPKVAMAELRARPSDSPRPPGPEVPEGELISSDQWAFARCPKGPPGTPSTSDICLARGFQNDLVYQFIYQATGSYVSGLGYVTTRDFLSFLRHASKDDSGNPNPALGVTTVLCKGDSQAGQYLRDFLYQGFNEDEQGGRVCDGVWIQSMGLPKLALNYRFAQPDANIPQHATRYKPDTNFPRNYGIREDPLTPGRSDGILKRPTTDPKLIHITSSTEYWNFRASLVDTDEDGTVDLIQPDNVRRYVLSGTQHGWIKGLAPTYGIGERQCQQLSNPVHQGVIARALFVAWDKWVRDGTEPPPSRHPRIDDGTLIHPDRYCKEFVTIPGVTCNGLYNASGERYFGPDVMDNRGVVDPDYLFPGSSSVLSTHQVLVPKADAIGNDIAGIRHPFVEAPVATLTGWNLRTPEFTDGDLCSPYGMMVCLHRTKEERLADGDPRPSLEELYGDHSGYVRAVADAALNLWAERLMLVDDVFQTIQEADQSDEREACWQYMRR